MYNLDLDFAAPRIPAEVRKNAKAGVQWTNPENNRTYELSTNGRWKNVSKSQKASTTRTSKSHPSNTRSTAQAAQKIVQGTYSSPEDLLSSISKPTLQTPSRHTGSRSTKAPKASPAQQKFLDQVSKYDGAIQAENGRQRRSLEALVKKGLLTKVNEDYYRPDSPQIPKSQKNKPVDTNPQIERPSAPKPPVSKNESYVSAAKRAVDILLGDDEEASAEIEYLLDEESESTTQKYLNALKDNDRKALENIFESTISSKKLSKDQLSGLGLLENKIDVPDGWSTKPSKPLATPPTSNPKPRQIPRRRDTVGDKTVQIRNALASRDFNTLSNLSKEVLGGAKKRAESKGGKLDRGLGAGVGTGNDWVLSELYSQRGFDGKPEQLTKQEIDAYSAQGEITMYRGMGGVSRQSFVKHFDSFRNGEYYAGNGIYGNGTYVAWADGRSKNDMAEASKITKSYGSQSMVMTIKKGSVVKYESELLEQMNKDYEALNKWMEEQMLLARTDRDRAQIEKKAAQIESVLWGDSIFSSRDEMGHSGRYAVIQGVDAVKLDKSSNPAYMLLLNRSSTRVATSSVDPGEI